MKVLIVDQDKNFSSAMNSVLADSKNNFKIDIYNEKEKFESVLKENDVSYDIGFVDIDFVGKEVIDMYKKYPNCKIIAFTSNSINKLINKPIFQRVFHKPVDIYDISNYLKIQNKIKLAQKSNIDSKKSAILKLTELGFNVSHNGTIYLADCICLAISKKIHRLKSIYDEVSREINVDSNLINWSVNYAVDQANNSKNFEKLAKFFCIHDCRKVTAKVIIDYFVNNN